MTFEEAVETVIAIAHQDIYRKRCIMTEFERGWRAACMKMYEILMPAPPNDSDHYSIAALKMARFTDAEACKNFASMAIDREGTGVAPADRPMGVQEAEAEGEANHA